MDFDELSARLLEEERKIHHGDNSVIALLAKGKRRANVPFDLECYGCGKRGHLKRDCPQNKGEKKDAYAMNPKVAKPTFVL